MAGDQHAQMAIYNKYYKAMYNTALRIVKHTGEAEDVMQDSFLTAFTKLHTFKAEVSFGAWLKRIVVNNSIYHYKKKEKKNEISIDKLLYAVPNEQPVEQEDTDPRITQVLEAIAGLKDSYRIALTLLLIDGYDYEEIAAITKMSYANCRTTISRAKASLRNTLTPKA